MAENVQQPIENVDDDDQVADEERLEEGAEALEVLDVLEVHASTWNDYIDLLVSKHADIRKAMICKLEDGAVWARTRGNRFFKATVPELTRLAERMQDPTTTQDISIKLEEELYVVTVGGENYMHARKGDYGVYVFKTLQTMIIVLYYGRLETHFSMYMAVSDFAENLKKEGF